jgi:hypothetical protein
LPAINPTDPEQLAAASWADLIETLARWQPVGRANELDAVNLEANRRLVDAMDSVARGVADVL